MFSASRDDGIATAQLRPLMATAWCNSAPCGLRYVLEVQTRIEDIDHLIDQKLLPLIAPVLLVERAIRPGENFRGNRIRCRGTRLPPGELSARAVGARKAAHSRQADNFSEWREAVSGVQGRPAGGTHHRSLAPAIPRDVRLPEPSGEPGGSQRPIDPREAAS